MTSPQFQSLVASIESDPAYRRPAAFALGIACEGLASDGAGGRRVLDTWYPAVNLHENFGTAAVLAAVTGWRAGAASHRLSVDQLDAALAAFAPFAGDGKRHANIDALRALREAAAAPPPSIAGLALPRCIVATFISDLAEAPRDAHDVYLRLHLLSTRKVAPHGLNLTGLFALLANVAWTSHGPLDPEDLDALRLRLRSTGKTLSVRSIDKFPRLTDYVTPSGVRIADADRVRLGAHLAAGTTVMHEGFVNFNAGTLGKSMVEGRISAGVVVDDGSDIGGGASIMGTLSGGGTTVIRIGKRCLLGANAGLGIPLGDDCTVEAGLYLTAGTKVRLCPEGAVVKAADLAGRANLLFRRHSQSGAVEVFEKRGAGWSGLNAALHA